MFIENHKKAVQDAEVNIAPYIKNVVVEDAEGYLSVMLPLLRDTIAIKCAESDSTVAEMVAHALKLFERLCTQDQAYHFYEKMMSSITLFERVMQFVTLMIMVDKPLSSLVVCKAVDKSHGKLLRDIRLIGDYFGFYNKDTKTYSEDIIRTNHPNGTTKELILPPEIIGLLMCYYINGQRVMASIS